MQFSLAILSFLPLLTLGQDGPPAPYGGGYGQQEGPAYGQYGPPPPPPPPAYPVALDYVFGHWVSNKECDGPKEITFESQYTEVTYAKNGAESQTTKGKYLIGASKYFPGLIFARQSPKKSGWYQLSFSGPNSMKINDCDYIRA